MKNFFFAPSKLTTESPDILDYLQPLGNIRVAEPDRKKNSEILQRLKLSATRSGVTSIACILTAPTENPLLDGGTSVAVGRGIFDIGDEALAREIPTFICRSLAGRYLFYPLINLSQAQATGNWKTDFARATLELPDTAENLFK